MLTSSAHRREAAPIKVPQGGAVGAGAMAAAAAMAYSAISVYRHFRFGSTIDLATQTQTIWGYSHFEIIRNTVIGIPNLLGDHFHPMLMVLAPLFWIWNSAGVLLVAQGVLLALAGVPIFLWGAERLGVVAGLAFQASFYLYWGILAGVLFDFHHVVFGVVAVSWALYATVTRRNLLLAVSVLVAMLSREDVPLTLIGLGFYIFLVQRRFVLGAGLMVVNAAWFGLLLKVILPSLGGVAYRHWMYSELGGGPGTATLHVLRDPIDSVKLLFTPAIKLRVWVASFGNWLFLPVLSPLVLVALPAFFERFWNDGPDFWTFHMQYSMQAAPILAFAAVDGAARLARLWPARSPALVGTRVAITVLVASALLSVAVNPLSELGTYVSSETATDIQDCLDTIPSTASVAATQSLLSHLATRRQIYQIPIQDVSGRLIDPVSARVDYIAIDLASSGGGDELRTVVKSAMTAGYGVGCSKELTAILTRTGPANQTLSAPFQRWLAGACEGRGCLVTPA